MSARSILRGIGSLLSFLVLSATLTIGIDIWRAREHTRAAVIPMLTSTSMELGLSDLSDAQRSALLKVEDPGFYLHSGVDLSTPGAGITTITQALAKRLYFDAFESGLFAKARQTWIARFALDPLVSKDQQLLLFINTVYLGPGVQGLAAGAREHFGRELKRLSEDQYLALIAMIISPATFDPKKHPDRSAERVRRIQRLLSGEYQPCGLIDVFYGPLESDMIDEIPPMSYRAECYSAGGGA